MGHGERGKLEMLKGSSLNMYKRKRFSPLQPGLLQAQDITLWHHVGQGRFFRVLVPGGGMDAWAESGGDGRLRQGGRDMWLCLQETADLIHVDFRVESINRDGGNCP